MPIGLHQCLDCKKSVHLFGCSVPAPNTKESCGQKKIYLTCNKANVLYQEDGAIENWKRKIVIVSLHQNYYELQDHI